MRTCDDCLVDSPVGRREASKRETHAAIVSAAQRLVSERGYDHTTVREIADAAGVTERTFYRYFGDKEGLIAEQLTALIDGLSERIVARPESEPPLRAVREAMLELVSEIAADPARAPLWTFSEREPMELLRRASRRPLIAFERALTQAVLDRTVPGDDEPSEARQLEAELTARVAVAVVRTASSRAGAAGAADRLSGCFDELERLR
jgi:AcrR family transcriptional regulator